MRKVWIHRSNSFKEADNFDEKYYSNMTGIKRLEIVQFLREAYFKINPDFAIAKSARLVPAFRFTFVNLQGRADRLNPRGFNLARRGNPKQISNQTVS